MSVAHGLAQYKVKQWNNQMNEEGSLKKPSRQGPKCGRKSRAFVVQFFTPSLPSVTAVWQTERVLQKTEASVASAHVGILNGAFSGFCLTPFAVMKVFCARHSPVPSFFRYCAFIWLIIIWVWIVCVKARTFALSVVKWWAFLWMVAQMLKYESFFTWGLKMAADSVCATAITGMPSPQ